METTSLYRKYRPQTFGEVVGQEHVVKTLCSALANNMIGHAYLFAGPRGTGKTTIARLVAKALNCQKIKNGEFQTRTSTVWGEPCAACDACIAFINEQTIDVIEVDGASTRGIDEIRELKEHVRFGPSMGRYKVFIIDEVHMLTKEAFNALLKTLEEPPPQVVFILATTEITKVPQTIISRTQRFDFRPLRIKDISEQVKKIANLEKIKLSDSALLQIAHSANGSLRDALSVLEQLASFSDNDVSDGDVTALLGIPELERLNKILFSIASGDTKNALVLINSTYEEGYDMATVIKGLIDLLRKLIFIEVGGEASLIDLAEKEEEIMHSLLKVIDSSQAKEMLLRFVQALSSMRYSAVASLPLELAILDLTDKGTMKQEV